jgi:hypothetical protein
VPDGGWSCTLTFSIALEPFDVLGGYGVKISSRPEQPIQVARLDSQIAMVWRTCLRAAEGGDSIGDRDSFPLPQ